MKAPHLPFLDGLRAVAILGVVAYHTWGHTPALHKYSWLQFAWAGNHGVELFFVISGFCLAYPTLRRLHEGAAYAFDYRSYIVRRMVRILPPFWVALTALVAIAAVLHAHDLTKFGFPAHSFLAADTAKEYMLVDGSPLHNSSFWSLCVEFRWYFIFPLALWLFTIGKRYVAAVALVAWYLYAKSSIVAIDLLLLPAFLMGIFAADGLIRRAAWTRFAPYGFIIFGLLAATQLGERTPAWQLAAFFFVVCVAEFAWLERALTWKPLIAIGLASYSIYLVHEPVIAYLGVIGFPAWLLPFAGVGAGFAFWALVERPLLSPPVRRRLTSWCEAFVDKLTAKRETPVQQNREETKTRVTAEAG